MGKLRLLQYHKIGQISYIPPLSSQINSGQLVDLSDSRILGCFPCNIPATISPTLQVVLLLEKTAAATQAPQLTPAQRPVVKQSSHLGGSFKRRSYWYTVCKAVYKYAQTCQLPWKYSVSSK